MGLWKSTFVDSDVPEGTYKVNEFSDARTDKPSPSGSADVVE